MDIRILSTRRKAEWLDIKGKVCLRGVSAQKRSLMKHDWNGAIRTIWHRRVKARWVIKAIIRKILMADGEEVEEEENSNKRRRSCRKCRRTKKLRWRKRTTTRKTR